MKQFRIYYSGNSSRAKRIVELPTATVTAENSREAVEKFYCRYFNDNYFPQENGEIKDCDGVVIAWPDSDYIMYDGGIFEAVEIIE